MLENNRCGGSDHFLFLTVSKCFFHSFYHQQSVWDLFSRINWESELTKSEAGCRGILTFYRSNILLWLVSCLDKDYSSPPLHIICWFNVSALISTKQRVILLINLYRRENWNKITMPCQVESRWQTYIFIIMTSI